MIYSYHNTCTFDFDVTGTQSSPLEGMINLCLFTDAKADEGDINANTDRRGWWGFLFTPTQKFGSKLWLLQREVATNQVAERAKRYIQQALQPLLDQKIAKNITVTTELQHNQLHATITLYSYNDEVVYQQNYQNLLNV